MSICGVSRRKSTQTTRKAQRSDKVPDLVKRDFTVATVNKLWVADITYVPTWSGFLYLSVVLDAFSRRVVGWAMATHLQSELVLSALNMALYQRRPEDVIHHSDQGAQYTSIALWKALSVRLACVPLWDLLATAMTTHCARASFATLGV